MRYQNATFYYYYYYKRVWLKCRKIHRTATTFYNGKDAFGIKHNAEIVRHSPGQNIAGKVLFWGTAGKLSVMSTRWRWTAGCFIRAKPLPEMHGRQWWNGASTANEHRRWRWPQLPSCVLCLCLPLCGVHQQDMAKPSTADNGSEYDVVHVLWKCGWDTVSPKTMNAAGF